MRKPDFFIVGAPKCGTTGLYDYLGQHPGIFVPTRKELHYFGTDLYSPTYVRDPEEYLSLFSRAEAGQTIGEASVWYLYSKRAAAEIKTFNPQARIIIMLREPVEMLHSLHSQHLYNGTEDIPDFMAALEAEPERKEGKHLPPGVYAAERLFYREVGRFAEQVQRFLDTFGASQVKVILYDDFKRDTAGICEETFRFLEVNDQFRPQIRVVNPNKRVRSRMLRNLMDHPPRFVSHLSRHFTTAEQRHRLFQGATSLNTRYGPRSPLPARVVSDLKREFAPNVARLGQLLDRDLSEWSRLD